MPDHLSDSQVIKIRDKGHFILIDKELTLKEKVGYIVAMCRDNKDIGLDRLPVESVRTLISKDWELLTKTLGT
jgi:hypothetical protein